MSQNVSADLFFSCNFNGRGRNLRKQEAKNEVREHLVTCLLSNSHFMIQLKCGFFVGIYLADRFNYSKH